MTRLAYLTDPIMQQHRVGWGHPENAERWQAVNQAWQALQAAAQDHNRPGLVEITPTPATQAQIERVHSRAYLHKLQTLSDELDRPIQLDADTWLSPDSLAAAKMAAGCGLTALQAVMSAKVTRAFCNVRPPGHHAEPGQPMGFCLLNSVAMVAAEAQTQYALKRVALVDFDVHHGNGTETFVRNQCQNSEGSGLLYLSSFQDSLFPFPDTHNAPGLVKMPLPAQTDGTGFRKAWLEEGLPALAAFQPQLLIVSAGFDAHLADPLGGLALREDDFSWLTGQLVALADKTAEGRVVSMLEGGYDLKALRQSALAHLQALSPPTTQ
ncbi:histone deacetylase family protein [Hydrogenovibrio halophilus]|uniref:histone deacetylase family protein n=1 Tax=Hydrogenovibrio halophilus TaxID=373391 RepID=UPI0003680AE8|nr:histone deacetylase family protein [Hydrogenovibrio halophilus]